MTRAKTIAAVAALFTSLCWGPLELCADPSVVAIDYPEELALEALVDYVSQTLDVRIVYGDELKNQRVTLRPSHIEIPKDRLLDLLRAVLRIRELALVPAELPGFYRVVKAAEVRRMSDEIRDGPVEAESTPGRVVTQFVTVPSGDAKGVAAKIKPFLSFSKSSLIEIPERGGFIVTDYEPVIARILRLVELVDAPDAPTVAEVVEVRHQDPAKLIALTERLTTRPGQRRRAGATSATLTPGLVTGTILVTGLQEDVDEATALIRRFDVGQEVVCPTRAYTPEYVSVERIRELIENVIIKQRGLTADSVSFFTDDALNRLYVTASLGMHDRIAELIVEEDQPIPDAVRRMRIYRPRNRTAGELLDTLTQLLEEATVSVLVPGQTTTEMASAAEQTIPPPGPNRPPVKSGPGQVPPMPPAQVPIEEAAQAAQGIRRVEGPDYVLTEDQATNAIIALGTPEFHRQLAELIEELDRRRAQVMIEMTLVAVSLSDSLSLGVELEALDLGDGWDYLLFSSFGLSEFDQLTGQRVLSPGVGVNGVLISPDNVPVVFKALATHGDNRIISAPRILVSDSTSATLRNVDEAPFTSVNASDTVATTSFGGFESAGTTLTVTPHVAEGDHLTLNYQLTFSNFTGSATGVTAPPPRTTNSFSGEVEVADGYTVVVGGLVVENESDTVSEVPLLGRIPVIGPLFQSASTSRTRSRIFAFIRPVILRDDKFRDLKYYSARALEEAELENPDFPPDQPMWMR
ncbi:MAG: hypothetical protein GY842_01665 [bacterium]|nr:hypothetical protein [bacterium]